MQTFKRLLARASCGLVGIAFTLSTAFSMQDPENSLYLKEFSQSGADQLRLMRILYPEGLRTGIFTSPAVEEHIRMRPVMKQLRDTDPLKLLRAANRLIQDREEQNSVFLRQLFSPEFWAAIPQGLVLGAGFDLIDRTHPLTLMSKYIKFGARIINTQHLTQKNMASAECFLRAAVLMKGLLEQTRMPISETLKADGHASVSQLLSWAAYRTLLDEDKDSCKTMVYLSLGHALQGLQAAHQAANLGQANLLLIELNKLVANATLSLMILHSIDSLG